MGSIDKAAIVFSIAIALVGVGIAAVGNSADNTSTAAPFVSTQISEQKSLEEKTESASLQDRQAEAEMAAAEAAAEMAAAMAADEAAAEMAAAEAAAEKAAEAAAEMAAAEAAAEKAAAEAAAEKAAAEAAAAAPKTVIVDIPVGTSVPGCETTNECFTPASISINAGDTVEWANVDTAAHTVTGGSPADGPSGVFDSSLLMASGNYSFTFDEAGSYDYFCMVHPWMVGDVSVN
jgi:plastocyanin